MTKDLTSSCLDGISKELKSKLIYRAGRVNKHIASSKRSLFDLAEELAGARDDCKAEDSETTFGKWVDETFGMSRSGAYRFISVHERIARPYVGAQSDLNFVGFDDYALYELAQIDTPEAAIKDALKIAKKGGRLTHKEAKALIATYTVDQEPAPFDDTPEAEPVEVAPAVAEAIKTGEIEATQEQLEGLAAYDEESQAALVESVIAGAQDLDTAIETGLIPALSIEDVIENENKEIEAFCRGLVKFFTDNLPETPWTSFNGLSGTALQQVKSACASIRTAKCDSRCPKCEGEGCKICLNSGRLPKYRKDQL